MREFQQRRRFRNIVFSRFSFALFLCLLTLLFFSVFDMYKRSRNVAVRNEETTREIEDLQKKKESMGAAINRIETGVGVEEELRQKFQVKKPGEEYVVIIDNNIQGEKDVQENGTNDNKSGQNIFEKFLGLFKMF